MRSLLLLFIVPVVLFSCSKSKPQAKEVWALNDSLKVASTTKAMMDLAHRQLDLIDVLLEDSTVADSVRLALLIQGGKSSRSTKQAERSLGYYSEIIADFRESEDYPKALFLTGFVYENDLKDIPNARLYYNRLMEEHPEHPFAEQARILVEQLGIPLEELIERFKEQEAEGK